jgi:AraC-like DNA-binding protein
MNASRDLGLEVMGSNTPTLRECLRRCHDGAIDMLYVHRRPAPPLDAFVESVWICKNERRPRQLERILPTGGAQLIVNLAEDETRVYRGTTRGFSCLVSPGTILTGVTTRFQIIDTDEQAHVAGVAFRPGGTVPFIASPACELSDADVPLESLWGPRSAARLREQLLAAADAESALDVLERALLAAWLDRVPHPAVAFALAAFHARPSVPRIASVTDGIGLSPKRFIERFKAEIGVTPKRYCRLLRFQRAVARAHGTAPIDWGQLALACGYFDQAHFIHEFRDFSGDTPTAYEAARTQFQNHVNFLQSSEA